jgi:hypothetical protein
LKGVATELLSAGVDALEPVGGGRNSRVYRLVASPSRTYALKAYFRHASDSRARMETEFASLGFLRCNGVDCVPMPIRASQEYGCAIYEWIEGSRISAQETAEEEIDAATSFVTRLADLRDRPDAAALGPASEACFSGDALVRNLRARLEPLAGRSDHQELSGFLNDALIPAFARIEIWSRRQLGDRWDKTLPLASRTLSPSDFGFHNALRKPAGPIVFIDLEYFGWDDPAKLICDFLLHPAMALSPALKRRFATAVVSSLSFSSDLADRAEAFYPLFGLKWCFILLNEFLPEHLLRRRFAGMSEESRREKQTEQLAKAGSMLRRILAEYEHFSYLH